MWKLIKDLFDNYHLKVHNLFILAAGSAVFCFSWSRDNYYAYQLENFTPSEVAIVFYFFYFLLASYTILCLIKIKEWRPNIYIFFIALFFLAFAPPILSLDTGAYVLGAKNFISINNRAYVEAISGASIWSSQLNNVWWLDYPTVYGPVFLSIVSPSLLFSYYGLLSVILGYKLIVLLSFLLLICIFNRILKIKKIDSKTIYLLALNPALLINWILEGHNDIYVSLGLLGLVLFLEKKDEMSGWMVFFLSIFIKYTSIIFSPVLFISKNKVDVKKILIFFLIAFSAFFLFFRLSGLAPLDLSDNLFFINRCFYKCTPIVYFVSIFGCYQDIIRFIIFTLTYVFLLWRYLYLEWNYLKFIFWASASLFFIQTAWLTPWYPTIIIPIGLLINEKKYLYLVILITGYSLLHYIGI